MSQAPNQHDVLAGYYGFENFGDDLFREILTRKLGQQPWARVRVNENRPERLARFTRNARAIRNILSARSLTLGGGSILGARPPFSVRHMEMAAARARDFAYTAIGVGVLEGLKGPPDRLLSLMSWVGLRSEADYLALRPQHACVTYMSDLAYAAPDVLLADKQIAWSDQGKGDVAIIPAGVGTLGRAASDPDHLRQWLQGNLTPFLARGHGVKILLLQPQNATDTALCTRVAVEVERLGAPMRQISHQSVTTTLEEIAGSAFVFSDRLHGAIVSHVCGVPFRLSRHHAKCDDLLADIRHPDHGGGSYAADLNGQGVPSVVDWTHHQKPNVARHADLATSGIAAWLEHLKARAA